ncbi:hypothetical protein CAOG_07606 [Capsaspora owczarzaki ATCC 30864]|nr:hypothetical protein CAOG_07606 [Capsaspora owczarzaki ATCC 30864]|eukprot:XP_004343480.1 hypothetical protein CAOG_07606 [Capsaspora owczarzaki ATCC 30864]
MSDLPQSAAVTSLATAFSSSSSSTPALSEQAELATGSHMAVAAEAASSSASPLHEDGSVEDEAAVERSLAVAAQARAAEHRPALHLINENDYVIMTKGDSIKIHLVQRGNLVHFGKLSFKLDSAIGQPCDSYYEVTRDGLTRVNRVSDVLAETEESSVAKSNQFLVDKGSNQKLTADDVQSMKRANVTGQTLISKLVENSSSFEHKTEFSQAKYIKKKQQRHLNVVRIARPTAQTLCEALFITDNSKIMSLRIDSLAHMLTFGNVFSGIRVAVVEGTHGLLSGACLERMGGAGTLLQLHHSDVPSRQFMLPFNFDEKALSIVKYMPLTTLSHVLSETPRPTTAEAAGIETSSAVPMEVDTSDQAAQEEAAPAPAETPVEAAEGQKAAGAGKRNGRPRMPRPDVDAAIRELRRGRFDCLLQATRHNPASLLFPMLPFLLPSRPFVVFCQFQEPLVECALRLRREGLAVNVQVVEVLFTDHQVLPSRSHPNMTTSGTGGFMLSGTTVVPPSAEEHESRQSRPAIQPSKRTATNAASTSSTEDATATAAAAAADASSDQPAKKLRLDENAE